MPNYIFQIETNNAEVFKTSITELAEQLKSGALDPEHFNTELSIRQQLIKDFPPLTVKTKE